MANGVTHARATKRNVIIVGVPILVLGPAYPSIGWLGLGLGLVIGHLLTPDIDHHYYTHEEWRIYRWSKLLGLAWSIYWWPYAKLHSHRGVSHAPFLGTVGRFFYLLWGPLAASAYLPNLIWLFWLAVLIGWLIQDFTHLWLDR